MTHAERFIAIATFFGRKKADEERLYADFLKFYEAIIRATPVSAVQRFGRLDVKVLDAGKEVVWGIVLTPTDFSFWESKIGNYGVRFVNGPDAIRSAMLCRMGDFAEQLALTVAERGELMDILLSHKVTK